MLGRGNTAPVYPGSPDIRQRPALALENYTCCTAVAGGRVTEGASSRSAGRLHLDPRALLTRPPFVWPRLDPTPEIADQAAYYGDGLLRHNILLAE